MLVLAFHRLGIVRGRSRLLQFASYIILAVLVSTMVHVVNLTVARKLAESNSAFAHLVASYVPRMTVKAPIQIPDRPPQTQPRLMAEWRSKYAPDELTLEDLTFLDFSDSATESLIENVTTVPPTRVAFTAVVNLERSDEVVTILIPASERTVDIMLYYSTQILPKLKLLDRNLKPSYEGPGDSNPMSSKILVFSKRVFIYHETPISQEELFRIDAVYAARGFSLISRSWGYMIAQRTKWRSESLKNSRGDN